MSTNQILEGRWRYNFGRSFPAGFGFRAMSAGRRLHKHAVSWTFGFVADSFAFLRDQRKASVERPRPRARPPAVCALSLRYSFRGPVSILFNSIIERKMPWTLVENGWLLHQPRVNGSLQKVLRLTNSSTSLRLQWWLRRVRFRPKGVVLVMAPQSSKRGGARRRPYLVRWGSSILAKRRGCLGTWG